MSVQALSRLAVIERLPAEHGGPIVVTSWLRELLDKLDDPLLFLLILCLVRQTGKTQAGLGIAATELFRRGAYVLLVSASAQQTEVLFARKLRGPLTKLLASLGIPASEVRFTKRGCEIPALGSVLEIVAPNEATAPGRSPTLLILDECRDIPDETFAALAPSVVGASGRILLLGTPGRPSGFFYELVSHPPVGAWLYRSAENTNPRANRAMVGFLREKLGSLFPALMRREMEAEFAEDGDSFLPTALIEAAIDDGLGELPSSNRPAFAFLDLSRKRDLSSLVTVIVETTGRLVVASIQVWDPKDSPTGETNFDDIRAAMLRLVVRFPNLRRLLVDEGAEAGSVLPFARTQATLSARVEGFIASATSNMELWGALSARLHAGTLALPRHDRLLAELKSLRQESFALGSKWRVVDGQRRLHRDVSVALAGAVFASGEARRCTSPLCEDPECDGRPPWGLAFTAESAAWNRLHPVPEVVAERLAVEQAVDEQIATEASQETAEEGLGAQLADIARAGFSRLAQAAQARQEARARRPVRSREERLSEYRNEQAQQQQAHEEAAARTRAHAEVEYQVRAHQGAWFPDRD